MTKEKIIKRLIPGTSELLPVIGLGTWQTFDVSNQSEKAPLTSVLKLLIDSGGSVVDSSPMYGRSEEVVGELSEQSGLNSSLFMATKVWTSGKESGIRHMKESMAFLRRKQLDLMQIHNLTDWQTHLPTLREWKEKGLIRYIGITHYTEGAYPTIEQILKEHTLDFLQVNYSIASRKAEERILPLASEKNVAVLINRPFEEGHLFSRVQGKTLPAFSGDIQCSSWGQFFLKFILGHPAVTCVIPGTSKPKHMTDNLMAGMGDLPDAAMKKKMIEYLEL